MKSLVIAAIITSFSIGSVFARGLDDATNPEGTAGTPGVCWTEEGRGGSYEVCGTVFPSTVVEAEGRGE